MWSVALCGADTGTVLHVDRSYVVLKLGQCYKWSVALCGADTGTVLHVEHSFVRC